MPHAISTCLMFEGSAEEAMRLYVSLFHDSRVEKIERYAAGEPGKEGSIKQARFTLCGHAMRCMDSPIHHAFTFTPATSLFVDCESAEEQERAYRALVEGGKELMPLGEYGFSTRFGWVNDRFGVSWQLNLA